MFTKITKKNLFWKYSCNKIKKYLPYTAFSLLPKLEWIWMDLFFPQPTNTLSTKPSTLHSNYFSTLRSFANWMFCHLSPKRCPSGKLCLLIVKGENLVVEAASDKRLWQGGELAVLVDKLWPWPMPCPSHCLSLQLTPTKIIFPTGA